MLQIQHHSKFEKCSTYLQLKPILCNHQRVRVRRNSAAARREKKYPGHFSHAHTPQTREKYFSADRIKST